MILQNYTLQTSPFKYNGRFTWSRSMCLAWSKISASHIILPSVTGGLFWISWREDKRTACTFVSSSPVNEQKANMLSVMHACKRHKLLLVLVCFSMFMVPRPESSALASQLSATTELRTSHKPQPFKVPVLAFHHTVKTMFIKTWWQTPLCWPHSP